MAAPIHVYETYVRARPERVWQAIVDPDDTRHYFHRTAFTTSLEAGDAHSFVLPDGTTAVEGVVEEIEEGHRLVITWRVLYDASLAEEPPSRVEWIVEPADADGRVTRVRLRHFDLGRSPGTWANVRYGWIAVLDGMKTYLETGEELGQVDVAADRDDDVEGRWHRAAASEANNATWELLDGRELSPDERADLLERAHAAAYHWRRAHGANAVNQARAAWLVSRCAATLGLGSYALERAEACASFTETSDAADFDRLYAHEALARAHACLGELDAARTHLEAARTTPIADPEDREIAHADLAAGPWYGLGDVGVAAR